MKNLDKENIKLLWECCQIPDFVKKTYGHHLDVVTESVLIFFRNKNSKIFKVI